jgi:3-oxoacyl-[acyl-carrier protein] reductase
VNNAAIAYDDIITNANYETLSNMFQVNVFTPMLITKYVIRNMLLHNNIGSIVHLSSISVHTGYKGLSMYAASKGALEAFSKNTAREWGSRKIRSNCIVAGFMDTDMSSGLTEDQKKRIYQRTSLKEGTSIDSVAETVLFLLSDKSKSITGQNIFVDNGTI